MPDTKKTPAKKPVAPAKAPAKKAVAKTTKAPAVKPAKPAGTAKPKAAAKVSPRAAGHREVTPEQRRYYVEVAAYYIAERHGFSAGRELADWTAAEAEIDRLLASGMLNP
jgi:hypothetical protein